MYTRMPTTSERKSRFQGLGIQPSPTDVDHLGTLSDGFHRQPIPGTCGPGQTDAVLNLAEDTTQEKNRHGCKYQRRLPLFQESFGSSGRSWLWIEPWGRVDPGVHGELSHTSELLSIQEMEVGKLFLKSDHQLLYGRYKTIVSWFVLTSFCTS